ncbi:nebulin isoform X5 [Stegostoma tigrinum]|uniref:nebulin isoform X5 n=1 Tax=Stegostoma tigrinum TaxID=3053191 RepID=UPI002870857B|nr:nebulin isoform X5 [Stegostoma tigrinum]XP_059503475.1 nebulin isoform X5 [Stegostoma tigrinum]
MEDEEGEYEEYEEYEVEEIITESEPQTYIREVRTVSEPQTFIREVTEPHTVIREVTQPYTVVQEVHKSGSGLPVREVRRRKKVDRTTFSTPYLEHSHKMKDLFSSNKYKEDFEKEKGKPYAIISDTPELKRIRKAQEQMSEVKYRSDGDKAKTICHVDGTARDIEHAKNVSQLVSKVLYKQKWEDTKDVYQLPPDAPELVRAVKFAENFSPKLYKEAWEEEKPFYYPYSDSPELRRVANAQKALSDIEYKKNHNEHLSKYTSLADPPDVEMAKKVVNQLSDIKYHKDYNKNKGKWSQTPCYDVAVARMNADNLSTKKYNEGYEEMKDQIYFMQTETPEYKASKRSQNATSPIKYRQDYEKTKNKTDYNTLPATKNPLLQQLKKASDIASDIKYKNDYEKASKSSINYCETPKFKTDRVLANLSDVKYKQIYEDNIKGHYVGSHEDPYTIHCLKVGAMKSDKNYKADYEMDKGSCYFPQTVTPEYEAMKNSYQCKDQVYKKHPDKIKFTQVADSPVMLQAKLNAKQLSDLNYKADYEKKKFKCTIPPDNPFFIQSRVNAYNLSDNCYNYDWNKEKAKHCNIREDSIPVVAAKAHANIASDVKYKQSYEKARGKHIGAQCIEDDPKILHSVHVAKMQSERAYKKDYEDTKTKYHTPLDMINVSQAKKAQEIASNSHYKQPISRYFMPPDSLPLNLAKKSYSLQSDNEYKAEYNSWQKGIGWVPFGSVDVEKAKRAMDILNERKYRQPPDTIKFTSIEDAPETVLAKANQAQRSDINYKAKGEKIIHKYTYPPDVPEFIQAKVNAINVSDNCYKQAWKKDLSKGCNITFDAIPIIAAKSARQNASDVKYKKAYEQEKGKHFGFQSLQDDPKLVHSMHVAKLQSDREYKKDYEKSKTKYHTPLDMVNITTAKKSQEVASNSNYRQPVHHYTYLPDAMSLELSKNMMNIQSDNLYKSDYNNWLKGIGWSPLGSIDVEKVKKAGQVLDEHSYRQHPGKLKFTSVPDSVEMVLAKTNALQLNDKLYRSGGEKIKHKYTLPSDVPQFIQAQWNAVNLSDNCYKNKWKKSLAKGYHLEPDAIPIVAAKSSRRIASDYKYKEAYEKEKGKHVGFRSLRDDPKLVHSMHVAKLQSDREYKKDYEKSKTKYHTPLDMVNITTAKKSQEVASNSNYRQPVHHYTYLPDAMSLELSKNMMNIQSDNLYKQDYNCWQKGIGWFPLGSLDVEKAKKAGDVLNEHKYRQHPDRLKFTSVTDSVNMVLATSNTKQLNEMNYKKSGEDVKHKYTLDIQYPPFVQAKVNAHNLSDQRYKQAWLKTIAQGHDIREDAIPIVAAKASRNIASDYRYKAAHEKEKGKHVGFRSLQDDPKLVHSMHVAKIQSEREYKKDYEKSKTKYHTPPDMLNITSAKKSQEVASNSNYRNLIHNYTYLPDAMSVVLSRNMMDIQSDNNYKSDYNNWFKGLGWVPIGSLDVEKAKKATDIASEKKYRQHPEKLAFTSIPDSLEMVLAKSNAQIMNKKLYTQAWDEDKNKVHVMPDTPGIVLSKVNQLNMSEKLYRSGWESAKKKGYNLMPDAISIKAAKANRDIASDYKYKLAYEKAKGKHIGFRSLQDDPKLVHFMHVAKLQSDREYKKDYEKSKTKYNTPLDMFGITAAKHSQEVASNINYKRLIHHYITPPDSVNLELARNMMNIQSDLLYKSDYTGFMKGMGWMSIGSLEDEKNKRASNILCEKKYRQHPETLKYTIDMESMPMELAKVNAKIMNTHLYKEAWEKDKIQVHVMPDTPEIALAKVNQYNISEKMYRQSMEEDKKKGYDLRADAIPIKAAKASTNIASDYKYKQAYEKSRGRHVGFRNLQDDPKLVHSMHVAKLQSEREYKKDYEKSKTKYHMPLDMLSLMTAKKSQEVATNANYRQAFHNFTYLPDAMNLELSRKMMNIQSDNNYKADLQWLRGIGWSPAGSLDVEKAKKATEIASEKKYRQHPETFRFTSPSDSIEMVLAKTNTQMMKKNLYTEAWEKDKTKVHVTLDHPDILQAKANAHIFSNNIYKFGWEQSKKKGYDLRPDAISIKAAKASTNIASDYKYKTAYRKQLGHHVGCRNLQDDPKMVWSMHVAKIQSDREYKKNFEKTKTKFNMPVDMLDILLAKKCQTLVSDIDYRRYLHQWTCLPDQTDVIQARKAYNLQSDILYKSDLGWLKGIGWSPIDSLDVAKVKKAGEILSENNYRQHPSKLKFTSLSDSMDMALAKNNAHIMNKRLYTETWEKDKVKIHVMPDTPEIQLAKANTLNMSDKLYRLAMEEDKKKGYDLRPDAISIKAAKASRDIASDYKYKRAYRKQLGHHVGCRNLQDDPKMVWSMHVAKIQSDREYKKDFEKTKTKFNMPVDMLDILLAKKCQTLVSDIDYRRYLHQWTCLPDQTDVIQAKKAYDLQSDILYKSDLGWLKGIGWSPIDSLDVAKVKKAGEILSENNYRQHPSKLKFTSLPDSMDMTLAKNNAKTMDKHAYTEAWEADKTKIHILPDTPQIILAKQNQITCSDKLYRLGMEESKKKGHNLNADAIPIKAAKASRDIASDYKYKTAYRKQLGHHVGCRNLQDDPKMVWSMHVAKIQSDREYKKDFEKTKTKFNMPVDMLDILLAKKCQTLVSDIDYRRYLHQWTCLPDQTDVIQARKAYDLQSDIQYKADLQWLKGIGWIPAGSLDVEKAKKASEILSEKNYRQPPSTFKFTSLVDSMPLVLAKHNSNTLNQRLYTEAWEKDKVQIHIMPDTPEILLASQNKINYSDKQYRLALEESKKKGYDLRPDAISIKAAKASRDIASDYKYKTDYRKQLGHHIGCRNLQDDPKMVWSMHVAKIQSDREYKKDFEKTKTKFNMPVDMLDILLAKKCQTLVSDIDYRRYLHQWTCLPDQTDVIQARKAYDLQSDILYKSDLGWLKGIGWSPIDSLDVAKVKKAGEILSENNYRQHPSKLKFTSLSDSMDMTLAKNNAQIMNKRAYIEAWEADKTKIHVMPDTPEITLARQNQMTCSDKLYRLAMEEDKKKGYDLRPDAISIKAAKASRDIASDYKYKTAYRKQLGHHVGCRDIQDDPKMVWSMHVAKIQSDREYKKDFEKTKTKFNMPVDMLDILLAKKCQTLVSDIDYRHYLHQWTCLPDQNDVIQARKAYDLQSDILYKSDLGWLKGIGWSPIDSLDVAKVKKAGEILSENNYRQHPSKLKFTSLSDSMDMTLAKNNAQIMNKRAYIEAWEADKTKIHVMPDTPEITLARQNQMTCSDKLYRLAMEEDKKKGYDLRPDAISIKAAKASRDIASDYKYKTAYRKQLGHHVGCRDIQDDPKMVWSMHVAKIQSDREYKKDFEKTKTKFNMPVDMLDILLAKKCQTLVSDIDYRHYLHQWTCLPDQNDVIQARKAYDLQSDILYKSDLGWLKGIGWSPIDSLDVAKVKKAGEILSENNYRQHPSKLKFTSLSDSMDMTLAKNNAQIMNKRAYIEAWEADKTKIHVMPDTPEIILARQNQMTCSDKLYRLAMEEDKKKGYDLRPDAISIKAAKASRDIASDYKYKTAYRKQLGHHVGCRNLQDDPKMVWSMHVAKIQSDREYKKDFEKTKTKFNMPVDMLDILLAKKCQTLVSDIDYRHYLHQWTCLPDQNDVIQARKAYDLQSDLSYKSDLEWLRGIGWSPVDSLDIQKVRKAGEILSEKNYRQPPSALKFTSILDSLELVLAKNNAKNLNKRLYTEAWDNDKTTIHVMPDTPEINLAKSNSANISQKLYHQAWEDSKLKGYDLRADAIPIKAAKASRDIASMYKYTEAYRKQLGHHIGCRDIQDDPKMVWSMHVAKIQSDREYKKDFEKTKTKFNMPVDMLDILLAKKCQTLVSDIDYRHYLHQWTCLPDQNDVIQARKAYDLQSDLLYKADMEWIRGCGWIPNDSLDVKKVQRAQEILSERHYRQPPDKFSFTSIVDHPSIIQAKINSDLLSDRLYRSAWENDKLIIHLPNDTPEMVLSKQNSANISSKLYKLNWEESKKDGYDLRNDAISIKAAKASREIASDYKYKEAYRKQLGHHIGCRDIQDDPKMVWAMHMAKIQSDLEYKKDFEKTKAKFNMPVDMLDILSAKKFQTLVSDIDYRHYLHQWTCLPDQNDVIQARKAYDLQSDLLYKSDMEWIRGCGWMPNDSLDVKKVQKAQEILSERHYRQPPDRFSFTSIVDDPNIVQAKINANQLSAAKYKEAWEKDKVQIHVLPDTPEILLAKSNAANVSQKLYKEGWEDAKKSIDYRADAIDIQHAKASRNIASDYQYKEIYRKQLGHHIGGRDMYDDPKMVWCMHVGKMQSKKEYRNNYEKTKANINVPPDMMDIVMGKICQARVSEIDYRHYLHEWTCLPDQNDVIQAKKAYNLQSDVNYKSDMEWLRGIGWIPTDSVDVKKVKHAQDILSDRNYRTKADALQFTPVTDRIDYVTAKQSGDILNDIKYREAWHACKTKYTLVDSPTMVAARNAARNLNEKLYKDGWEKLKATGYKMPVDAVSICHARASQDKQSELKYKADYVKQRGHHIGCHDLHDDPKMVWCMHVGKMQSSKEYRKEFEKTKANVNVPLDMLDIVMSKICQGRVSEIDYRHYLHEWTCLPDQNDVIQAKKAYDLQSDYLYKSDLEWVRGCGWIPLDSVEHKKVKNAQAILDEKAYKEKAVANFAKFTPITDMPEVVQAKINTNNLSDLKYKETFNLDKGKYIGAADYPHLAHSRKMAKHISQKVYKDDWDSHKALGYTLPPDYLPLVVAKHADNVSSELKYKELYEKLKGHYLAGGDIKDFPAVIHAMAMDKMRNMLEYKKNYEDTKAAVHLPNDMISNVVAKRCQHILSDLEYRTYLHHWTCLPDEHDVIHAKKAQEILSDFVYKDDLNWLKGMGCFAWDTPEILRAKHSYDLQSEIKYRTDGKKNFENYSVITDTPVYVTAVQSGLQLSDVRYKEDYEKNKDKYTTVLDTVDYNRTKGLKAMFSSNAYKLAWDKVKATSYTMPGDSFSIALAKNQKDILSPIKYREEYEKFKALYTLPRSVEDDPHTVQCLKAGKLSLDRLYRQNYENNKMKVHIMPDMLEVVAAKDSQAKVSYIDYRKYLHEWTCLPDLQINIHAKKVCEQLSDVLYKDDLNWLKGIGCNVWDTPQILHAKKSYDLQSDIQYKAKAEASRDQFTPVMDTPVYRQNVTNTQQLSDFVYHNSYMTNIKGTVAPTTKTVDLDRARHAYKLQSENLYRDTGRSLLPTGYTIPADIPFLKHAKNVDHNRSDLKYKEAYEHMKARGYKLIPETISITAAKKADLILNQRLYRLHYDTHKDKIHPTHDTPELRQVKATQEAISDLAYKSDYFRFKGQKISLPITPELLHHRYVGIITSNNKYKEDLQWLRGIGCFLYGTPEMIRVRDFHKFWTGYDKAAKKIRDKHTSVLDTPEYRRVTELKTHLSNLVYRAQGNEAKTKYTTRLDTVDLNRAKHGQKIQSQYLYVELATKDRPHYIPHEHTTSLDHAKHVKDFASEKKYKEQYEKFKSKYTTIPDTPTLLISKKAYIIASDLRYKEAFEHAKGHYRTVKDALNIVYHRKVTDDISEVKYKEKYIQQLGLWRSIPDPPENMHHRMVTDAISTVKYKEDLGWLRGIGCYAWDTPDLMLAEKNKELYSQYKYRESVAKLRNNFKYTADTPHIRHAQAATAILDEKSYKAFYEKQKSKYTLVLDDPRNLLAKRSGRLSSQWIYKKDYEKAKDKYTSIFETPDNIRTKNVTKLISDIKYKLEHNRDRAKGYTSIHDTPMLLHMRSVKDKISDLKYKENYERNKANCNIHGDAFSIRAAKSAYKNTTNLDYKKKYEATKAKWMWTADRPDFVQAYKASQQQSEVDYKLDREYLKGCKISVPVYGDKNMILAVENTDLASGIKYKLKHEKERGIYQAVPDTPQMLHAKSVINLMSEKKYKEAVKKELPHAAYMKLPETRGTSHVREVSKLLSGKLYKEQFEKDKGKSSYSIMMEPPDVKHAMNVAKCQSNIDYKKDAKSKLAYTSVADRPDILKATEAAKLISDIGYRTKAREEASRGIISLGRPDIELAKEVSKLTSQVEYTKQKLRGHGAASYDTPTMRVAKKANILSSNIKYKEKFEKEFKGQRPKFDLKESSGYKSMKDANIFASEVIYKQDLKKMHKPVTDMSESLQMQHNLSTSKLSSQYLYKKEFEKSKGHYQLVSDSPEQIHLKEATELQSQVKYKEQYEKERGKAMLDFETPVYITAMETQHMQSEKKYKKDLEEHIKGRNLSGLEITPAMLHVKYATKIGCEKEYRKDLEEGVKGKGLMVVDETPEMMRARNATYILNEKEYKRSLEEEIKGKGLVALANETPDFARAKNATEILSQVKYKQLAEMDRPNYTTVIDTPDIIHAHNVKNLSSQKQYKAEAVKTMSQYVSVTDTPEMHRVRENQKNISTLQYTSELKHIKGKVTTVKDTPEILRAKENQKNFSLIAYKEEVGTGTSIKETPEMERVKRTQEAISSIKYKENVGQGTAISDLPEVKRVKETQKNISSIKYKENVGQGTAISDLPEIQRVKETQKNISSIKYKENVGQGTAISDLPEVQRVKETQKNISSIKYKENVGKGTAISDLPEVQRVKETQKNISLIKYKENVGQGTAISDLPEVQRVKETQRNISLIKYKENVGQGTAISDLPEVKRVKETQKNISSIKYKENVGQGTAISDLPEVQRAKETQKNISSIKYKENVGQGTAISDLPEVQRVKETQKNISSIKYKECIGKGTAISDLPEVKRVKETQKNISSVLYKENLGKGTAVVYTPEMQRVKRNQENISSILYSDSFRKQVQGRAAYVLDTPEMRRVRDSQRNISTVKYHEDFEKTKGSFTPVVTDPITERVKKNMQDFSDISYRGIQRRVVEMQRRRVENEAESLTDLRVWRTNPGSVFDYDPAEDNIQSRSLHMLSIQAQRRSREHSRSASALSLSGGDEKSELSEPDQTITYYNGNNFFQTTTTGYQHPKTTVLPQQRSSSVATQQTTVSSIPSHPSTTGKTYRAIYDYSAADADEISFKDGDVLTNVQSIDEGWMYGTVQRTGMTGMLPANYVDAI